MAELEPKSGLVVGRNLALELVRVTEAAALAASLWMGKGDKNSADGAAVEAMRRAFDTVDIAGTVVIGEGEMDEAPMLFIGEKVGLHAKDGEGLEVDIAVDPLEGTTLTAKGMPNAMAVVALAEKGGFLHAPDVYMEKLAVGPGLPPDLVDIDETPERNLRELARAKKAEVSDLVVCLLDRDRHKERIAQCRAAGARIMLIPDGDVAGLVAVSQPEAGVDMYMGSGGAPEGVLAAAALRCIGGQMQGRLLFEDDGQRERAREMGVTDPNRKYTLEDMARGDVMFAATGVTTGPMLRGVRRFPQWRVHAFHRHAEQVGHGALRGGAPQLRGEAPGLRLLSAAADGSRRGERGGVGGAGARHRPQRDRAALGVARRGRRPARARHRPAPRPAGAGRATPGGAGRRPGRGGGLPGADAPRASARPSVLADMDAAASRLASAVREAETVAVFGDYDVDGACSGALMVRALRELGCEVTHYVPDRIREGYGPNPAAIRELCARGATLIVCVDCGIAAHAALEEAKGQADVIVLDHHKAEGALPRVHAAVNPNRLDCGSGLRHLCAAAVAFLAVVALHRALRRAGHFTRRPEPRLLDLLDLVALATVCDVMPLTGVNRALVAQGLKVMARRGRAGLAALLEVGGVRDAPTAHSLGFVLGPRINAAGRVDEPDLGLRLLLCDDPVEARGHGGAAGCGEPAAAGGGGGGAGRRAGAGRGPGRRGASRGADLRRGLAPGRGRHRRRADEGAVQPAGLRRRRRGRDRQGLGPLGAWRRSRRRGDRGAAGGAAGVGRRARHGGGVLLRGRAVGCGARLPERAAARGGGAAGRRRMCSWRARWRWAARPRISPCRWSAWRPSARATRSRTSCCRAPAWCGRTGWARRATRCAPSSKARAGGG